jgi:hypothetical protein
LKMLVHFSPTIVSSHLDSRFHLIPEDGIKSPM